MYLRNNVIMFPRDREPFFTGGKVPEELEFFWDVKAHSTNYERMQVELIIVIFILPILLWLVAISTLFGGRGRVIFMHSYFHHAWRDASEWLTGVRLTRLLSSLLFDVWADIFCVANIERFLRSNVGKFLGGLQLFGRRASAAVEVVREERRSSGALVS